MQSRSSGGKTPHDTDAKDVKDFSVSSTSLPAGNGVTDLIFYYFGPRFNFYFGFLSLSYAIYIA
jgi:hypothetical protein